MFIKMMTLWYSSKTKNINNSHVITNTSDNKNYVRRKKNQIILKSLLKIEPIFFKQLFFILFICPKGNTNNLD